MCCDTFKDYWYERSTRVVTCRIGVNVNCLPDKYKHTQFLYRYTKNVKKVEVLSCPLDIIVGLLRHMWHYYQDIFFAPESLF